MFGAESKNAPSESKEPAHTDSLDDHHSISETTAPKKSPSPVQNTTPQKTGRDVVLEGLRGVGLTASMAPVAGKTSGVIDEAKWCALCERDGHESIDCPFDD
jgi:hypothetical protein